MLEGRIHRAGLAGKHGEFDRGGAVVRLFGRLAEHEGDHRRSAARRKGLAHVCADTTDLVNRP